MPKVYLTETQRAEKKRQEAVDRSYRLVADGLAAKKNRENLRNDDIGEMLGVSRQTAAKILRCEDVSVSIATLFKLIYMLGFDLGHRETSRV